jgi:hypothetical protein
MANKDVKVMDREIDRGVDTDVVKQSRELPEPNRFERIGMLVVKIRESEDDSANLTACLQDLRDWIDGASKAVDGNGVYEVPPVPATVRRIVDLSALVSAINKASSGQSDLVEMREQLNGLTASR